MAKFDMNKMLKQAQQMQEQIMQAQEDAKKEIATSRQEIRPRVFSHYIIRRGEKRLQG